HVDLVCQIGSPRRIAAFLQRVGRSGHTVGGTPKGRLFPLSRDDLVECTALLRAVRRGDLDRAILPDRPLDVLTQQIAAEVACEEWTEDALFDLVRGAYPYRNLERVEFDDVIRVLARGVSTRRGRRGALVHHDAVNGTLRGRRGTRMTAITSGGAIPEIADYRVMLEPEGTLIGTLNEDFAVESMAGDVFQLGNTSWRILRILPGVVRVADAHGEPPNIPFWLGEAPSRSVELSEEVSRLRQDIDLKLTSKLNSNDQAPAISDSISTSNLDLNVSSNSISTLDLTTSGLSDVVAREYGISGSAALQIVAYLAETQRLLGVIPSQETIVLERFFDEAGGMQLV
ncbi:MAG: ATP-dependent DNA helicase, partial [Longimicrobiales bacterium]